MKRKMHIVLLVVTFALSAFGSAFAAVDERFVDVPAGHWAYDAVTKLSKAGLIEGYSDGTFRGEKVVSRYEMGIIVARIMTKVDKADASQKALVDKLSTEFSRELESLNVRVTALEKKTAVLEQKAHVWFGGETRIRFYGDNPGQPGYKRLQGADQFDIRQRFKFWGDIDKNISWHAYLETSPVKFGNNENVYVDVAHVTLKDYWGFDSIRMGRYAVDAFGTGLYGKPTNGDGLMLKKKFGDVDFKGYIANVKASPVSNTVAVNQVTTMSNPNTVTSVELGFKPSDTFKFNTAYFWNDIYTDQNSMNIANGSFKTSHGWDVSFLQKFDGFYLMGEYMNTQLKNATGLPSNPKGWYLQLSTGRPIMILYPIMNAVDVSKPGTDAWVLSYRSIDPGTLPAGIGGFSMMTSISYTSSITNSGWGNYNIYTKGTDNVKAWYLAYQRVLAKNFLISLDVQQIDIKNLGVTSGLNGSNLDKTYMLKFEYFY